MQRILAEAAAVCNATSRAIAYRTRDRDAYLYPNSAWHTPFIGGDYEFSPGRVLNLDGRTLFFYITWGVTPAMTVKMVGAGSQYAMSVQDARGAYLDGDKSYRLHLPPLYCIQAHLDLK